MERQGRLGRVKVYADLCDGAVELVVFVGVYSYLLLGRVKLNAVPKSILTIMTTTS